MCPINRFKLTGKRAVLSAEFCSYKKNVAGHLSVERYMP